MYSACLIGCGYWGNNLYRNFQNSDLFIVSKIVDTNNSVLTSIKKKNPLVQTYKDYKKAIKEDNVDLVVVSTPTISHFKISKYALENSKHVLIEKPICLSLKQVKVLNKIARKNKKLIFVDYPFLFSGSIAYLKKVIDKKKYGKILEIESFREQAPLRKDNNVIWDLGVHDISILLFLLNQQPSAIKTIKKKNLKNYPHDVAYINLKYKNGVNVLIKNSWVSATKIRFIKIKFTKAIIYCDENEPMYKIKVYKNKSKNKWSQYDLVVPDIDLTEPLSTMVKYIYYSIKNNKNKIFNNNLNEKITSLLQNINKVND